MVQSATCVVAGMTDGIAVDCAQHANDKYAIGGNRNGKQFEYVLESGATSHYINDSICYWQCGQADFIQSGA